MTIDKKAKLIQKLGKQTNTMHKCMDSKPERAADKLNDFIPSFSLEEDSFKKFTRSAELHALALASDSKQNQIINLWISLESIIPAKNDEIDISNIEHIIKSIIPFLSLVYFDRLIFRLERDLLSWNSVCINKLFKGISGKSNAERLIKLIALPELEDKREELKLKFNDFHLLANRFDYFCFLFSKTKNVAEAFQNHQQRVEWQIRRIYRARNLIIHSGKTPSYTEILVENTHDYLDVVMGSLMKLATQPKEIYTIEQGFKYAELSFTSLYKWLSFKGNVFTEENIGKLIDKKVL